LNTAPRTFNDRLVQIRMSLALTLKAHLHEIFQPQEPT
jgi:hypothetical protein